MVVAVTTFTFHRARQCTFSHHGRDRRGRGSIFRLDTPYAHLELYVSNQGRSVRVWDREKGRELT